jgi:XTP/dITP diphosphohydrolase
MKIVLATHNRDKVSEIRQILGDLDVTLLTVDDFPGIPEPAEEGATLEENALAKAREIRDHTGLSALADDTGLFVDALDGAPGARAARFAGEKAGYAANTQRLLEALRDVPDDAREAEFRTVMAVVLSEVDRKRLSEFLSAHPEKEFGLPVRVEGSVDSLVTEGVLRGAITREPAGMRGFGYDPVFFVPSRGQTLAEMLPEEKNALSHRYRALVEMREFLIRLSLVRAGEDRPV